MAACPRIALAAVLAAATGLAFAQAAGGPYRISKQAIAGGGGAAAASGYRLVGTAGQPLAGAQTGGVYRLVGGFQQPVPGGANPDLIFANGFQ